MPQRTRLRSGLPRLHALHLYYYLPRSPTCVWFHATDLHVLLPPGFLPPTTWFLVLDSRFVVPHIRSVLYTFPAIHRVYTLLRRTAAFTVVTTFTPHTFSSWVVTRTRLYTAHVCCLHLRGYGSTFTGCGSLVTVHGCCPLVYHTPSPPHALPRGCSTALCVDTGWLPAFAGLVLVLPCVVPGFGCLTRTRQRTRLRYPSSHRVRLPLVCVAFVLHIYVLRSVTAGCYTFILRLLYRLPDTRAHGTGCTLDFTTTFTHVATRCHALPHACLRRLPPLRFTLPLLLLIYAYTAHCWTVV